MLVLGGCVMESIWWNISMIQGRELRLVGSHDVYHEKIANHDEQKFHFRTRKQELNSVEGSRFPSAAGEKCAATNSSPQGTRANLTYLDALAKFHKQQGTNLSRLPYVDKKPLDLYRLKKAVEAIGGFEKVCKLKKWAEIGRELGYSGKIMSSLSTSLKNSYARWLWPYEEFLRLAKPGVQQQLEHEYGGPFTPSPAPSPMKRVGSNTNTPGGESPAQRASDALQGSLNGHVDKDKDHVMTDAPNGSSGHASANGNARVASPAGFPSMSRTSAETRSFTPTRQFGSPLGSSKNTPELRPSALGNADSLKRQLSFDSIDSGRPENAGDKEEGENGSRRSKRLKKGTCHFRLFRKYQLLQWTFQRGMGGDMR